MSSAPWSQNYITFTYKTKKCMPISVQRTSWTPLFKLKWSKLATLFFSNVKKEQ